MNLKNKWDSLVPQSIQKDLSYISKTIKQKHGEVYIVGGSVRDLVMNRSPKEFDLATSLHPQIVKSLFPKVIETGIKHGTVTVLTKNGKYEVTTYRTEFGYSDSRRPDKVEFNSNLEEDLKRRDFTMNALALNVETLDLLDYHNGLLDISKKIIRAIGDPILRFQEDGLRPIRAIRFKTALGFEIEESTYQAIYKTRNVIQKIAVERFNDELYKILKTNTPSVGITELIRNKIFSLFMEVQEKEDNFSFQELDLLQTDSIPLKFAFIWKYFLETSNLSISEASKFCSQLKLSKDTSKQSLFWLEFLYELEKINFDKPSLKKILSKLKTFRADLFPLLVKDFLALAALRKTPEEVKKIQEIVYNITHSNIPLCLKDLAIDGNFIAKNFPHIPKEEYGNILKRCLYEALETENNSEENLYNFIGKVYAYRK